MPTPSSLFTQFHVLCAVISWRNNLACDSAPLVCRDPLPFATPHVLTGYLLGFHSLWWGYPMILPLLMAWKWAVKISTTLRMWVQPWESLILAEWDWLVLVQLSSPRRPLLPLSPQLSLQGKALVVVSAGGSVFHASISVKNKPCLCQRSKIFQQGRIHLSITQVLSFPWQKSPSESLWSQKSAKAQHGAELRILVCPAQPTMFNDSLK